MVSSIIVFHGKNEYSVRICLASDISMTKGTPISLSPPFSLSQIFSTDLISTYSTHLGFGIVVFQKLRLRLLRHAPGVDTHP